MKGVWQDAVIAALPQHEFLDPRTHGLRDEKEYTRWDLHAVDCCDLVFAYMTDDNPSGYGLNLEIGYAFAKGKPVVFVQDDLESRDKYFGMARVCSRAFCSLEMALRYVESL